jgi:signal recognition particle GTPase
MVNVGDNGYVSQTVVYSSVHNSKVLFFGLTGGGKILPQTKIANLLTKNNKYKSKSSFTKENYLRIIH